MRTTKRVNLGLASIAVILGAAVATACGSAADAPSPTPPPAPSAPGNDAGTGPVAPPPPAPPTPPAACVPKAGADLPDDNFEDTNCDGIDGDVTRAIFVAPSGSDAASGSVTAPVKTLAKAITLAHAAQKDVYACTGTFAESIAFTTTNAVNIYSGYDCAAWGKRSNDHATVAPAKGLPLTIQGVTSALVIDRFKFHAADGVSPSESSIAAHVANSHGILFNHALLQAGNGADAATPSVPAPYGQPADDGAPGESLSSSPVCYRANPQGAACTGYGNGGRWSSSGQCFSAGGSGGNGGNVVASLADASGNQGFGRSGGTEGQPGGRGANGAPGAAATQGCGTLTAAGYVPNAGQQGANGEAGGGGGGGHGGISRYATDLFSDYTVGGGGGAGGFGGCGGNGGAGAGGGGASIGITLFEADVKLVRSQIVAGNGGRGGASNIGGSGQLGGAGGAGGAGTPTTNGVRGDGNGGAQGGVGGTGGPGGAGAGGPSLGILASGIDATLVAVTFNLGYGGKGGSGTLSGQDGADGAVADDYTLALDHPPTDGGAGDGGH